MNTINTQLSIGRAPFYAQFQILRQLLLVLAIGLFSSLTIAQGEIQKINLNTADAEALQFIPGIGASKANSIIELRTQKGGFKSMDELLEVRGIGEKVLQNIIQYGTLEGGVSEVTQEMLDNPPGKKVT